MPVVRAVLRQMAADEPEGVTEATLLAALPPQARRSAVMFGQLSADLRQCDVTMGAEMPEDVSAAQRHLTGTFPCFFERGTRQSTTVLIRSGSTPVCRLYCPADSLGLHADLITTAIARLCHR